MNNPQEYLEAKYGSFPLEAQALTDLVIRLLQRVDAIEAQVARLNGPPRLDRL